MEEPVKSPCAEDEQGDIIPHGDVELTEPPWAASLPSVPAFMHNDLQIIVHNRTLEQIWQHAGKQPGCEVAGILLGDVYQDDKYGILYVEIQQSFALTTVETGPAHVIFTHDVWTEVDNTCRTVFPGLKKLGWYHSHPGIGVFMSPLDIQVHAVNFPLAWHVALVVDAVTGSYRFFRWRRGQPELTWQPRFFVVHDDLLVHKGGEGQTGFERRIDDTLVRQMLALVSDMEWRRVSPEVLQTIHQLRDTLERQRRDHSSPPTKNEILLTLIKTILALADARAVSEKLRSQADLDKGGGKNR